MRGRKGPAKKNFQGEKRSGVEVGPPISIVRLVLMLTTVGQQYLFLQQHDIIPSTGVCHKCHQVIPGSPIVKGNNGFGFARSARQ